MVPEIIRQTQFDIHLGAGNRQLEAVWIGPEPDDAPTLVFLHEGLGCVALWREFPVRLVALTGCGALVFSRFGYGGSDPCELPRPVDFMHHEGRSVLPEVIRQTGIHDHFLVGHSDGGSIALIYAGGGSRPGLKGVITLAAHIFCEDLTRQSIRLARDRYLNGNLKLRLSAYHGDNTDCAFRGWSDVWLHQDFRHWTIESFLPYIRVPLLAIQGADDPYGSQAQIDCIKARTGSTTAVEVVNGCGHSPHLEKSDAVLARIAAFVAERINAAR